MKYALLGIIILAMFSCTKVSEIEAGVRNNSHETITVVYSSKKNEATDTVDIISNSTFYKYKYVNEKLNQRRMNDYQDIPIYIHDIFRDSLSYQGNPNDLEKWSKILTKDLDKATFTLYISNYDFN